MNCQFCPFLNVEKIITATVKRTAEQLGIIPKYISRQELLNEYSITTIRSAEKRGGLTKIKNGYRNSKVMYLREEYEHWQNTKI